MDSKKYSLFYDPRLMPDEDSAYKFLVPICFDKDGLDFREGLIMKLAFLSIKALDEGDDPNQIVLDVFDQDFWVNMNSPKDSYNFASSLLSCDYVYNIISQAKILIEGPLPERFDFINTETLYEIYEGTNLREWLYMTYCEYKTF